LAFLSGTKYELNTVAKKEQTKNKKVEEHEEEEEEEEQDENFTKITKKKKAEVTNNKDDKPNKGKKNERMDRNKKKKGPFFKPEILQEMREGRKKDREQKQATESVDQTEEKPKKKKEQKSEEKKSEESSEQQEKKNEKKDKKSNQNKNEPVVPVPVPVAAAASTTTTTTTTTTSTSGQEQKKKEQKPKTSSPSFKPQNKDRDPNKPRIPGIGRGASRIQTSSPIIKNMGSESASLDDFLNSITSYYTPNIFQRLSESKGVLAKIISFLPLRSILNLSLVDRFFHNLVKKEDQIWREICRRDFGINSKLPNSKSFKHTYKISYPGKAKQ